MTEEAVEWGLPPLPRLPASIVSFVNTALTLAATTQTHAINMSVRSPEWKDHPLPFVLGIGLEKLG